jgi:hypothetical protein
MSSNANLIPKKMYLIKLLPKKFQKLHLLDIVDENPIEVN